MIKNQSDQLNQASGSMLSQKTNEDYNKQQPSPNDPNFKKGNRSQESAGMKMKNQTTFDKKVTETKSEKDTYTCPMHPEVISDKPGKCPKCGMQLVKKN